MTFKLELNLFNEDKDLAKLEDLLNEFDIFKILAIQYKENNHSDLLAWLFNPKGNHHLESKFLKLFLKIIVELHGNDPRIPEIFADFTSETLRGVEVIRERENRIDIFIRNSKFVIVIENKIMAEENNDQLLNYFEYVEKTYLDRSKLYVFLSIDKEQNFAEDRENYITIKYKHLISILDDILLEIPHDETKYFILNFKKHIRRNLMPESENDYNLLCNEIYLKHRNAIQNIYIEKERRIKIIGDLIGNYFII